MKLNCFRISVLCSIILLSINSFAQGPPPGDPVIQFSYDDSGNRICRKIIYIQDKKSEVPELTRTENDEINNSDSVNYPLLSEHREEPSVLMDMIGNKQIIVYPNPTTGFLHVEIANYSQGHNTLITVTDLNGKLLIKNNTDKAIIILDLSGYAAGAYLMTVTIDKESGYWKIIKQ